jgi:hypothetical protein
MHNVFFLYEFCFQLFLTSPSRDFAGYHAVGQVCVI